MAQHRKMILIFIMTIVLLVGTFLAIYPSETSTTELVVNGGFEHGMNGWEFAPPPLAVGGVNITDTFSKNGAHSLRLIGGGPGYLQRLDSRSIFPRMLLSFYTLLNVTAGEKGPEALFHLYFLPTENGPTYYLDITVTPANSEDLALVFEPNPGIDVGGIYLRFNREPVNSWIHISVDVSRLIERYLPDFHDPRVNRIMLESAEGGKVYFDDISLNATYFVHFQFIYLAVHYFLYSTIFKTFSQLLSYSVVMGVCIWIGRRVYRRIYRRIRQWWRGRRAQV